MARVGVASIVQETNTFSPRPTTIEDFEAHGLYRGAELLEVLRGTNTEAAGAHEELERRGVESVPLIRAWAMSGGTLTAESLEALALALREELDAAGSLDGLVLSLHGAMVAEGADSADEALLQVARDTLGPDTAIGVCLDLHANVTEGTVAAADVLVGYHTYPHIDMASTGARIAGLVADLLSGKSRPVTALAKRPMLLPPETTQTIGGPIGQLRRRADERSSGSVLDVSLFPVQPWLDVPGVGFAALVTTDDDAQQAASLAEEFAAAAWAERHALVPDLVEPAEAIERARTAARRPVLLSESADSPTAGAAADSPAMVAALLEHGSGAVAYVTLVDPLAAAHAADVGEGAHVQLTVGAGFDRRFHSPVELVGEVTRVHDGHVRLTGPVFTGMDYAMGRSAVVRCGSLHVLITERPAPTFDPEAFRAVGLNPEAADLVVVRSANLFRAGWGSLADGALILDLPGASTPRFARLDFQRATRPLFPLDEV
jgi:microcystin degradation protein MlrC